jgi:predicted acyltransferase
MRHFSPPPKTGTISVLEVNVKTQTRLMSLDAFRGLTMAAMVVVNNPGDWSNIYAPLEHAAWNGWTPTDLIFPFFLFIVGVSMTLSRATMGNPWKIGRRGCIIFGLGLFLAAFPRFPFATLRIPGVLQRIALCYVAAALLFRWTAPPQDDAGDSRLKTHGLRLLGLAVGFTLAYWAVMALVPPPGGTAGDWRPSYDIGAYIDRTLLGGHLWSQSKTWDPEGLLSTIPAIGTTILGLMAGLWLASSASGPRKAAGLAVAGIVGLVVGQVWDLAFPINKGLWTSSYVWFTAGAASLSLAVCFWLIDVRGWKSWSRPFVILGLNAITLFVGSGLLAKTLAFIKLPVEGGEVQSLKTIIYRTAFVPLASPINASLLYALANLAVMSALLYVMYRRGWFLKV